MCKFRTEPVPHTIYGVVRKSDLLILYVGQTSQPIEMRLSNHLRTAGSMAIYRLVRETGVELGIVQLDEAADHETALLLEGRWIRGLRAVGAELLNGSSNYIPVACVETGKTYRSLSQAADANGLDRYLLRQAFNEGAPIDGLTFVIRHRHPSNDNGPKPGEVIVDPEAIPDEVMDRLAIELAKALAELDHDQYHTSST